MSVRGLATVVSLSGLAAIACSSSGTPPPQNEGGAAGAAGQDGGAAGGGGGQAGGAGAGGGGGGGTYAEGCPSALPAADATCASDGRQCSYGSAPRGECRDVATCTAGHWAVQPSACAPPAPAAECPATEPAARTACAKPDQLCAYPGDRECTCVAGSTGWACEAPSSTDPDCPPTPANAGTVCTGTVSCTYLCGLRGTRMLTARCAGGAWTWGFVACGNTN